MKNIFLDNILFYTLFPRQTIFVLFVFMFFFSSLGNGYFIVDFALPLNFIELRFYVSSVVMCSFFSFR